MSVTLMLLKALCLCFGPSNLPLITLSDWLLEGVGQDSGALPRFCKILEGNDAIDPCTLKSLIQWELESVPDSSNNVTVWFEWIYQKVVSHEPNRAPLISCGATGGIFCSWWHYCGPPELELSKEDLLATMYVHVNFKYES